MPKLSQTTAQNCIAKKQRLCLQLLVLLFYFTLEDRHIFPSNILFWFIISTSRSVHPIVAVFQSLSYILLCNPMDYSPPGFPVLHYLPEFLRFMSTESVMLSNHPIFCHPFLLLLSIFSSIRVFSNKSALRIRWSKYWSFSFSISPSSEYSGVLALASFLPKNIQDWSPLGWTGWISLQSKGLSRVFSNTTVQKHQFFGTQPSLWANCHIHTWLLEKP